VCPLSAVYDIANSIRYGNASTGLFVAGGIVSATGIVLIIVAPGGGSSKPDEAPKTARISPWVGPGVAGLGAVGRF
jgi:hypothetical protein